MPAAPTPVFGNLPHADPGHPDLRSIRHFITWLARRHWKLLSFGVILGIIWMGVQALIPFAIGQAITGIADGNSNLTHRWSLIVLALGVAQMGTGVVRHRVSVKLWLSTAVNAQQLVTRRAAHLGSDLTDQMAAGEVVAVTSSDVDRVGASFDMVPRALGALFVLIAVSVTLIATSPVLGLVVAVGIPLMALGVGPLLKPLERREAARRERVGRISEIIADIVSGLRVLRGIGGEDLFLTRFTEASQQVRSTAVHAARVRTAMDALQVLLPGLFILAIIWGGGVLVSKGQLEIGQLISFYGMSAFLWMPLRAIGHAARVWTSAIPSYRRIRGLLAIERQSHDPEQPLALDPTGNLVDEISGVEIRPGRFSVIACDSPESADLLAERLSGFRDLDRVTLGGATLSTARRSDIRSTIVLQDKDPVLLSGTVRELLDIPSHTPVSLDDALSAAEAMDVIESLDGHGLDAIVVEKGRTLSGGQRQRLALARTLLTGAQVLVLVEPTSAVDSHTEARMAEQTRRLRAGLTTVVFSTSPLLLDQADEVFFVVQGRLHARGTHAELLHLDDLYREHIIRDLT